MTVDILHTLFRYCCHQRIDRSLGFGGVAQPLCARCSGLYLGFALVGVWLVVHRAMAHRPWLPRAWGLPLTGLLTACVVDGATGASHIAHLPNGFRFVIGYGAGTALPLLLLRRFDALFPESRDGTFFDGRPRFLFFMLLAVPTIVLGVDRPLVGVIAAWASAVGLVFSTASIQVGGVCWVRGALRRIVRWDASSFGRAARTAATFSFILMWGCSGAEGTGSSPDSVLGIVAPTENVLLSFQLFGLFVFVVGVVALFSALIAKRRWRREVRQVRAAILNHLRLSVDDDDLSEAAARTLALVPSIGVSLDAGLADLAKESRIWLCFFQNDVLAVGGNTGRSVAISSREVQAIHLVEHPSRVGTLGIDCSGHLSTLQIKRLDDMVRVVNVMIHQGTALRHSGGPQ